MCGSPSRCRQRRAGRKMTQSRPSIVLVMDGIHDMGGMQGFGAVVRDEVVFHTAWERRACALSMATAVPGNIDSFRHSIERLDPATYLTAGYYGRWLASLEVRLTEWGML